MGKIIYAGCTLVIVEFVFLFGVGNVANWIQILSVFGMIYGLQQWFKHRKRHNELHHKIDRILENHNLKEEKHNG